MESHDEPTVICSNCEKNIPESKSFLHEAYCFRNIIRCSKCNEPIDKKEVDTHENEVHKMKSCSFCKKDFEMKSYANHVQNCNQKPKLCPFCDCEISNHEFNDHTYQCGSRTRKCQYCDKNIIIRELEDHEAICAIESFDKNINGTAIEEEYKPGLLEDTFTKPKKKATFTEPIQPPKKPLEQTFKKRLAKLNELKDNVRQKTVNDEPEWEEEFYGDQHTKKEQTRTRRARIEDENDDDNKVVEVSKKDYQNRNLLGSKKPVEDSQPRGGRLQKLKDKEKNTEDFYSLRKGNRPKKDLEEELQETLNTKGDEFARAQNAARKPTNNPRKKVMPNPPLETLYPETYGPQESNDFHFPEAGTDDLNQFLQGEDAELLKAIQASLESYKQ